MMNVGERMGHQACAPCKYQRRKCTVDCFLAPYFPMTRWQDFLDVHKLFGVSNVVKILNAVQPHERALAIETIIMQAKARRDDPTNGCLGIARKLFFELEDLKKELALVHEQIGFFREQKQKKEQLLSQQQLLQLQIAGASSSTSTLLQQLGISFSNSQPPTLLDLPNIGSNYIGESKNLFDFGSSSCHPKTAPSLQVQDEEHDDVKPFITPLLPANTDPKNNASQKNKAIMKFKDSEESSAESSVRGKGKEKV